jgi:tetratricopeptide (TPR) repeat protein
MKIPCPGAAVLAATMALAGPAATAASGPNQQPAAQPQQLFEAGQYEPALKSLGEKRDKGEAGLPDAFLAAHAALKLNQNDRAKEEFARLTAADDKVWKLVGESATAAVDNDRDRALELAVNAVNEAKAGSGDRLRDFHAYYQLGLARTRKEEWAGAAEAFARAAELNSNFAYAHYYAGLSYSRVKRPDQVVRYMEMFLKLAPKAPERSAVTSLLRSIKGL